MAGRPTIGCNMKHIIAIDLGGTSCRAALLDSDARVLHCNVLETLPSAQHLEQQLASIIDRIRQQHRASEIEIAAVCVGFPGVVHPTTYAIRQAPNIAGMDQLDLKERLTKLVGVPVVLENDTNLGAIAEGFMRREAAQNGLVYIALGTGLGCGLMVHGTLWRGQTGGAGEICNMGLSGLSQSVLGALGCDASHWLTEDLVSGQGIAELYRLLCAAEASGLPGILADWLHPPVAAHHRHVPEIFAAAQAAEPLALRCIDIVAHELAHAIDQIQQILDPGHFVLAGGIGARPDFSHAVNVHLVERGIQVERSQFQGSSQLSAEPLLQHLPTASLAGAALQALSHLQGVAV